MMHLNPLRRLLIASGFLPLALWMACKSMVTPKPLVVPDCVQSIKNRQIPLETSGKYLRCVPVEDGWRWEDFP